MKQDQITASPEPIVPSERPCDTPSRARFNTLPDKEGPPPTEKLPVYSGSQPPDVSRLPTMFGRYELQNVLGQGGMGTVFLARDMQLDRLVALKILHFTAAEDSAARERFIREARSAATIHHAHVCPVYDVGEIAGTPYLTMAYIEGRPLSAVIPREGDKPLPERPVALMVRRLALGLEEAHRKNVIHRDLKPTNIMLNRKSEPVIMDFGLARRDASADPRLTQQGMLIGTPAYMSPEQAEGNPDSMGPACDIYSLGVVLYELLTGRVPFEGSMLNVITQLMVDGPKPPSTYRRDLAPGLEEICLKAMAKKPADRYQSMSDLAAALADFLKATLPANNPTPQPLTPAEFRLEPVSLPAAVIRPVEAARSQPVFHPKIRLALCTMSVLVIGAVSVALIVKNRVTRPGEEAVVQSVLEAEPAKETKVVEVFPVKPPPKAPAEDRAKPESKEPKIAKPLDAIPAPVQPEPKEPKTTKPVLEAMPAPAPRAHWPTQALSAGQIAAPDLSHLQPQIVDDFHRQGSFPQVRNSCGYAKGKFMVYKSSLWNYQNRNQYQLQDFACQAVGRLTHQGSGEWCLALMDEDGSGVLIGIGTGHGYRIAPSPKNPSVNQSIQKPWTRHPALNFAVEANSLLVISRGRTLEVYVNGAAICNPLVLDHPFKAPTIKIGAGALVAPACAEFQEFRLWPQLGNLPPLEKRGERNPRAVPGDLTKSH
jgi:serine/threonine protein kinase